MRSATQTIMPMGYSRGNLWLGRLVKSNWFACGISILLHGIIFLVLYHIVFQQAIYPKRHIIPEARLAAGSSAQPPQSTIPLQITRESTTPPTDMKKPQLNELPIAAYTFDEVQAGEPALQPERAVDLSLTIWIDQFFAQQIGYFTLTLAYTSKYSVVIHYDYDNLDEHRLSNGHFFSWTAGHSGLPLRCCPH